MRWLNRSRCCWRSKLRPLPGRWPPRREQTVISAGRGDRYIAGAGRRVGGNHLGALFNVRVRSIVERELGENPLNADAVAFRAGAGPVHEQVRRVCFHLHRARFHLRAVADVGMHRIVVVHIGITPAQSHRGSAVLVLGFALDTDRVAGPHVSARAHQYSLRGILVRRGEVDFGAILDGGGGAVMDVEEFRIAADPQPALAACAAPAADVGIEERAPGRLLDGIPELPLDIFFASFGDPVDELAERLAAQVQQSVRVPRPAQSS